MTNKVHNPASVIQPLSRYSQALEVPAGKRWLVISGQLGLTPDGSLPETVEGQHEQCWKNILALLASAGMGAADLVKITTFVTTADQTAVSRAVRDRMLDGAAPAATLIVVAGLAKPEFKVEIEALAAAD